jgi:type I site-specific restriction endonuclease
VAVSIAFTRLRPDAVDTLRAKPSALSRDPLETSFNRIWLRALSVFFLPSSTRKGIAMTLPTRLRKRKIEDFEPESDSDHDRDDPSSDDEDTEVKYESATERAYQTYAIKTCLDHLRAGKIRVGLSAPTGSGKTVIMAKIIKGLVELLGKEQPKVLIIVPSTEIGTQVAKTLMSEKVNGYIGREQGQSVALPLHTM